MDRFPPSLNVVQVKIRSGTLIDQIEFVMADGQVHTWGGSGGNSQSPFELAPDEHIVKLVTRQGDSLDGLSLHTSKGRDSPWFGGRGGNPHTYEADADNPIIAIERDVSGFCPRIRRVRLLNGEYR